MIAGGIVSLLGALLATFMLDSAFLPEFKENDFLMHWVEKPGTSIEAMQRITVQASKELRAVPGVKIVKLDVESNPSTVVTYNVRAMPTLMVFKDGEPVDVKIGYGPSRAQLTKWLESYAA